MCDFRANPTWEAKVSGSGGQAHQDASVSRTSALQASGLLTPSLIANSAPPWMRNEHHEQLPSAVGIAWTALE
jgi:hypothetical protein